MYTQDFNPVSDSLGLTAIFAALPILTLFVLLGGLKMKAQWAALISLGVAMAVALIVYGMPADQTGLSALEGAAFGLFPIMWIVVMAIWVYNMTVETGHFAVLRRSFGRDLRGPAHPGRDHRLLLRRPARGARRLRDPRGDYRRDDDRRRLQADQGGRHRARCQHGPGGVRRDRDADHHALRDHQPRQGRPRRDGRTPDAVPRSHRAADPDRHGGRAPRHQAGVAHGRGRRPDLRPRPVRLRELHLGRAHGHRCVAARNGLDRRVPAHLDSRRAPDRRGDAATGRFARPAAAGGSVHNPAMEREVARRDDTRKDPPSTCCAPTRRT